MAEIVPGEWTENAFTGYDSITPEEEDGDVVKGLPANIYGLGTTSLEISRYPTDDLPKRNEVPALFFDGENEKVISLDARSLVEKRTQMPVYRLTRWSPRVLQSQDGIKYSLAVRFPSGRIVQQELNEWSELTDETHQLKYFEIMSLDSEDVLNKLQVTYLPYNQNDN